MFHVKHIRKVTEYLGVELSATQENLLEEYGVWLSTEGVRAGGIGPGEIERVERRHLADSLLFASAVPTDVGEVWDLGTGVGLPGIPLAILRPATTFVLIDRSGRRVDLLRRFVRIADLGNCEVVQGEIEDLQGETPAIVTRASLPPKRLRSVGYQLLASGGVMIVGGSWIAPPDEPGWVTEEIPGDVLDQPVWLLMMRRA